MEGTLPLPSSSLALPPTPGGAHPHHTPGHAFPHQAEYTPSVQYVPVEVKREGGRKGGLDVARGAVAEPGADRRRSQSPPSPGELSCMIPRVRRLFDSLAPCSLSDGATRLRSPTTARSPETAEDGVRSPRCLPSSPHFPLTSSPTPTRRRGIIEARSVNPTKVVGYRRCGRCRSRRRR